MVIKINRESIKVNPNAGKTSTLIPGPVVISFKAKRWLPKEFILGENVHITNGGKLNGKPWFEGQWIDGDPSEEIRSIPGIEWDFYREHIIYEHLPDPEYLYSYENPIIQCCSCGHLSSLNDTFGVLVTDEDEFNVTKCPNCGEVDTFGKIEYESIQEALKALE